MIELTMQHQFENVTIGHVRATTHPADDRANIDIHFASSSRALALFGDSGAGKSTALNAIAGLLRPSRGRIVLDGQVLFDSGAALNVPVAKRRVGYVFQDGRLFPHMGVRANLLYGARASTTSGFDQLIGLLDLEPLLMRRPATLSGGERQRVAIGRALLASPRILLLDEPLTGLHLDARVQVLGHLQRLKRELGVAMVFVSHQPGEVIALADDVVHLSMGRVAAHMPVAAFAATIEGAGR